MTISQEERFIRSRYDFGFGRLVAYFPFHLYPFLFTWVCITSNRIASCLVFGVSSCMEVFQSRYVTNEIAAVIELLAMLWISHRYRLLPQVGRSFSTSSTIQSFARIKFWNIAHIDTVLFPPSLPLPSYPIPNTQAKYPNTLTQERKKPQKQEESRLK